MNIDILKEWVLFMNKLMIKINILFAESEFVDSG